MNINYIHPADQLVMFMQRIYDKGMTTTSGGNLSIMDEDGNIWITPAGIDKGTITRGDIVCVKPDGTALVLTVRLQSFRSMLQFIKCVRICGRSCMPIRLRWFLFPLFGNLPI